MILGPYGEPPKEVPTTTSSSTYPSDVGVVKMLGKTVKRHPIYDALDAHLHYDHGKAAAYYLASQIAELMQRIEKLEKVKT